MRFFQNKTIGWKPMCISQVTNRLFALVILLVMGHFSAWATEADLRELMQEDDYIKASLIVVSPGDAIYSAGGHLPYECRAQFRAWTTFMNLMLH